MSKEDNRKVWLIDFPTYQYNEDVKSLAGKDGLKIIDSKFGSSVDKDMVEKKPPKLTKKGAKAKPKKLKQEEVTE